MDFPFTLILDSSQKKNLDQLFEYYRSKNKDLSDNDIINFIFNTGLTAEFKSFKVFSSDFTSLLDR